ncbi:MAG: hypothetical protein HYZ14_19490 [Bacteroidetes bacterium]|nr:hypothetical protein [Bacteroidota bacterium]
MQKSNKILLGWLAFVFVAGHSLAIIIYAFPEQMMPASLKQASSVYVAPVFEQTWSLFAPCPLNDTRLRVKYYFENDSTDWIDPMVGVRASHAMFRFTYHSDLAVGESNLLYYTGNDLIWMGMSPYEPFPADSSTSYKNTSSYWMMRSYIYGTADFLFEKRPVRALAECSFHNVKTGESGTLILPSFSWEKK